MISTDLSLARQKRLTLLLLLLGTGRVDVGKSIFNGRSERKGKTFKKAQLFSGKVPILNIRNDH